ncbi:hypothetical protein QU24_14245 [Pantoea rodasii]|uniref:Uncharacterized protein n=1 Tax=Pantoea rodasii TaxID=1076549 RepID=A0A0B1R2T4_9GAMM|nr:hypothetical protein QU24_14245 [Pantoea rodasii]
MQFACQKMSKKEYSGAKPDGIRTWIQDRILMFAEEADSKPERTKMAQRCAMDGCKLRFLVGD